MKYAKTDKNYAILTKRAKVQHEKKFPSNLKCIQGVGWYISETLRVDSLLFMYVINFILMWIRH